MKKMFLLKEGRPSRDQIRQMIECLKAGEKYHSSCEKLAAQRELDGERLVTASSLGKMAREICCKPVDS